MSGQGWKLHATLPKQSLLHLSGITRSVKPVQSQHPREWIKLPTQGKCVKHLVDFRHFFLHGRQFLWLLVCFPIQQVPAFIYNKSLLKRDRLKGKNLLPRGTKFYLFKVDPFYKGSLNNFERVALLNIYHFLLILVLLNPDIPCLCKQCRSRSVGFKEAHWSGSALFAIHCMNLYQQSWSSNLIGWKFEVGVVS